MCWKGGNIFSHSIFRLWCSKLAGHHSLISVWETLVSVEANPALYWPSLLWLTYTHKFTWTTAGTLSLKVKRNHCVYCFSLAGTEYRHWCWFIQPTTEQFACLALSDDVSKHCCLTAGHTELHLGDERPPLRYLLSPHRGGQPVIMTPFVT